MILSYLSTSPLKPAMVPGPAIANHCTIDKLPKSQGMRRSVSSRFDIVVQIPKASTGVLVALGGVWLELVPVGPDPAS